MHPSIQAPLEVQNTRSLSSHSQHPSRPPRRSLVLLPPVPSITVHLSHDSRTLLAALLGALAAIGAALASLLAHEAAAQRSETGAETAAVLLLLRRRGLLVLHLLALRRAVVHLLLGWAAVLLLGVTLRGTVAEGWSVGSYADVQRGAGGMESAMAMRCFASRAIIGNVGSGGEHARDVPLLRVLRTLVVVVALCRHGVFLVVLMRAFLSIRSSVRSIASNAVSRAQLSFRLFGLGSRTSGYRPVPC